MGSTLLAYNLVNTASFGTVLVPFKRYQTGLSNGTKIVPNGSLLTLFWAPKVGTIVGNITSRVYCVSNS